MHPLPRPFVGLLTLAMAAGAGSGAVSQDLPEPHPDMPAEFQQIIPRGRIASVDSPTFVPAAKAQIPDDAWVLGVAMDGIAHAYSLNLLNHHEIVNDQIGGTAFAAVW